MHSGSSSGAISGSPAASEPLDQVHVLIVDDDSVIRAATRALLEAGGYRVSEVEDGTEAVRFFENGGHASLMVLDLDMPRLGGRAVLRHVRSQVRTMGLPVIVLTGTVDPKAEVELLEQGADDYIRKPIDPPSFMIRVKSTLRRSGG